ncbi:MAG: dTMP kinase [Propionibacteriales bacterium]|nr:dTMP kinase [Propionibacteriales bacterium]
MMAVLRLRAFRRLWVGLGLSSLGDWLGLLALTAMAGTLAGGGYAAQNFAVAGVLLLRVLPAVVMGPIAGYVADRLDRRWTLVAGDVIRCGLFASIPLVGTLWWVFVVTVLVETVSLVWLPAKDATVPNLVPRERLEAANQLSFGTMFGSALPAAALFTLLTKWTQNLNSLFPDTAIDPIDVAIYCNALSYLVSGIVIVTLHEIPRGSAIAPEDHQSVWRTVIEGWAYVGQTKFLRGLLLGIFGAFGAGGVVIGVGRVFVRDLEGGDPAYGVLFGSIFLGLALGVWVGPRMLKGLSRRRLFGLSLTVAGLLLGTLALVPEFALVTILTVALGFCAGITWITGYTLVGLEVEDAVRGRTFAFVNSMIRLVLALVLATAPLVAGLIGTHTLELTEEISWEYHGAAATLFIAAVIATAVGVTAYRHMDDRRGVPLHQDLRKAFAGPSGQYAARGLFVALEGGEGSGKSTQARLLAEWLEREGYRVVLTREPGDTKVGSTLRDIVLDPATGHLSPRTEALLYAADKAEHVDKVIIPALDQGAVVITDRYVDSTLAYQGAGRELLLEDVERVARWSTAELRPHLTVLLDLPPDQGLGRFTGPDRLEAEPLEFHQRVRASYRTLASADAEHYAMIDAARPPEEIAESIRRRVRPLLSDVARGAPAARSEAPTAPATVPTATPRADREGDDS